MFYAYQHSHWSLVLGNEQSVINELVTIFGEYEKNTDLALSRFRDDAFNS
jgi:hypothetical protein